MPEYQQLASGLTWLLARVADHLWQATVGFLVVLLLTALLRRGPARVRYLLWLMAGVQLLLPMWICGFLLEQSPWRSSPPKSFQRSESLLSLPPRIFSKVAGEADQFAHPVTLLSNSPSGAGHLRSLNGCRLKYEKED
jgi:hypothetical protein